MNPASTGPNAPCGGVVVVAAADGGRAAETKREPKYRSQGTGNLANKLQGTIIVDMISSLRAVARQSAADDESDEST